MYHSDGTFAATLDAQRAYECACDERVSSQADQLREYSDAQLVDLLSDSRWQPARGAIFHEMAERCRAEMNAAS